jgi:hypothetical protein
MCPVSYMFGKAIIEPISSPHRPIWAPASGTLDLGM